MGSFRIALLAALTALLFGAPEDVRGARWDRLTVWPSSG